MSQLTLETFLPQQGIDHLNDWIFQTILPYIKGRVLETNSGSGLLAAQLLEKGFTIQLNATSEANREFLREKFGSAPLVRGIHMIDFSNPRMDIKYLDFQSQFSTVIAFKDVAHSVFYDTPTLRKAARFLRPGGHLIVLGQCPICFFPSSEEDFKELKRFNRDTISNSLVGCEPLLIRFFNWNGLCFVGIGRKPPI